MRRASGAAALHWRTLARWRTAAGGRALDRGAERPNHSRVAGGALEIQQLMHRRTTFAGWR